MGKLPSISMLPNLQYYPHHLLRKLLFMHATISFATKFSQIPKILIN